MIENNTKLIDNEERFQILLERSNQRADLLETHFNRNKKINPSPEDEIIEEFVEEVKDEIEETANDELTIDEMPNDYHGFTEWLKKFNNAE